MATLTADAPRTLSNVTELNQLPVVATDIIYEGAAVGVNGGNARPLVAADPFAGIAVQKADNASGAAGAMGVDVWRRGDIEVPVAGASATSVGVLVYCSDDNTFTLTSTSNTKVGRVVQWMSGTTCRVRFGEYFSET